MATVSNFEAALNPDKSALQQFTELFMPLFTASANDTKRQAVAALSQCTHVPLAVALFIGSQSISIAAPFLASSPTIDDDALIMIARTQGAAHAKAIMRRRALSLKVIRALLNLRQTTAGRGALAKKPALDRVTSRETKTILNLENMASTSAPKSYTSFRTTNMHDIVSHTSTPEDSRKREEELRKELRQIAHRLVHDNTDRLKLRNLSAIREALLMRAVLRASTPPPHSHDRVAY